MSRVFNLSQFNNIRKAIDVYQPPSAKVRETMTPEQLEQAAPLPVIPFQELIEQILGIPIEKIDNNTIEKLRDYYLEIFNAPETIGPAFEAVKTVALSPDPNRKIAQLQAAIDLLRKDKNAKDILVMVEQAFGKSNLSVLKERAYQKFDLEFDESLVSIFKQRVNKETIPKIAEFFRKLKSEGSSTASVVLVGKQIRQDVLDACRIEVSKFIEKCQSLGLDDSQTQWILTHGRNVDPTTMPFFEKSGVAADTIQNLLNEKNTIFTKISLYYKDENPSRMFNKNVEAMKKEGYSDKDIKTMEEIGDLVGGEITTEQIMGAFYNLSRYEVPTDPRNLIDETINSDSDLPREIQMRHNPLNLATLKALLEKGGYVFNGKALKRLPTFVGQLKSSFGFEEDESWEQVQSLYGEGKSISSNVTDFPEGGYVDTALWYLASTVCGSTENFLSMVKASGAIFESEEDGQEQVDENGDPIASQTFDPDEQIKILFGKEDLIDPVYKDFGLAHDTKDQKRVVQMLRAEFGLEVVPSEMGIPALDDCNINVEGFLIDFVIVCSALQNWLQKEGGYHPVVAEQVNFIGEYYGFNFDFRKSLQLFDDNGALLEQAIDTETGKPKNISRVEDPRGLIMPDGSIAKTRLRRNPGDSNRDKIELDATYGTPIDPGSTYKIRTEWKKMTEDFVATITGNAAIHVSPGFTTRSIKSELDKCNIIYKLNGQTVENSPLLLIEKHALECNDSNCDSKKTSNTGDMNYFRKYNTKEALIVQKIVELKSNALVANLQAEKMKTAQAKSKFIELLAKEKGIDPKDLWNTMSYKEFLDRFNDEHGLDIKGFGRHEIYQYYSQKMPLVEELFELRKSPEYSYEKEIAIRQKLNNLREQHLGHFQQIFDANSSNQDPQALLFQQKLAQLEQLRELVVTGQDGYSNEEFMRYLNSIVLPYKPHVEAQKKKALNLKDLFRIAIKS